MKNNNNNPNNALVYGRIPPHDKEIERAVLGAILIESNAYDIVREIIPYPECFYIQEHSLIYEAMLAIERKGGKIDMLTVTEYLTTKRPGLNENWAFYVANIGMDVVSSAHIIEHAGIVMDKYRYREQIKIGAALVSEAYKQDEDSETLIDGATGKLMDLSALAKQDSILSASSAVMGAMNEIEEVMSKDVALLGIDTGLSGLNDITFGWQPTDFNIVAARPAQGKTSLALHLLMATQKSHYHEKKSALFFSLEMSTSQLIKRMQSNISGVSLDRILKGHINDTELSELSAKSGEIGGMRFFIDDQAALTIPQIRARAKRVKKLHGLDIVFVDYLQLIRPVDQRSNNRDQAIGEITRGLKLIAKELEVPVIALSQMSRAVESRSDQKPKLSDLRESGNIEQDASVVIFIYHAVNSEGRPESQLVIAKNRNGSVGDIPVVFDKPKQRWYDASSAPDTAFGNPSAGITGVYREPPAAKTIFGDSVDDMAPF